METLTSKDIVGQKLAALSGELDDSDWKTREIDYVANCKIVETDVPVLIEMAFDWADGEFHEQAHGTNLEYQPVFAWRTLGQLGATEAIEPLLELSNVLDGDGDEWFLEEFPHVFGLIGEPALEPLSHFLGDKENLHFARACAAISIRQIGTRHTALRDSAVQLLTQELGKCVLGSEELNGSLVSELLELKAVESVETLEKVHSLNLVDTGMCGKWSSVKSELAIEGSGLAMPEFPYNSIYSQLSPAVARSAAARMFDEGELDHDALEQQNDTLSRIFEQTPEFEKLTLEYWSWPCTLLELAANYCGVSFVDISIRDVNEVLFELFPRKVSTPADSAAQIVDELHHFFSFIARVFEIKQAKAIAKSLTDDATRKLKAELADSSNFGMAKSMWAQGSAAGFDMSSQTDVAQFVALYNDSLNPSNAGNPKIPATMTADEKRAFNKKRKKQLAKKKRKKKKR